MGCHLCEDMIAQLRDLQTGAPFELEIVDVDGDPGLKARYGARIPVLACAETELCCYQLDVAKVDDFLSKFG
jgi:hypothetical protein